MCKRKRIKLLNLLNDNFLKNVIKINQLYQLYKHLYQKIIKSNHCALRHRVDWEYGPFLTVYHVKHSELYNEPIVYQIKSAGGILIKLRESPDIIHVRLEKEKKHTWDSDLVVLINQANQTWKMQRIYYCITSHCWACYP